MRRRKNIWVSSLYWTIWWYFGQFLPISVCVVRMVVRCFKWFAKSSTQPVVQSKIWIWENWEINQQERATASFSYIKQCQQFWNTFKCFSKNRSNHTLNYHLCRQWNLFLHFFTDSRRNENMLVMFEVILVSQLLVWLASKGLTKSVSLKASC